LQFGETLQVFHGLVRHLGAAQHDEGASVVDETAEPLDVLRPLLHLRAAVVVVCHPARQRPEDQQQQIPSHGAASFSFATNGPGEPGPR
jgi:hypothetical protein